MPKESLIRARKIRREGTPRWMKLLFVGGLIVLLWTIAAYVSMKFLRLKPSPGQIPSVSDLMAVLFGASSIALIIFSILVGAGAIVGLDSIKKSIKQDIEADMHERLADIESELRGRVFNAIGFMIGTLHSTPDCLEQESEDKDYLSLSVYYCQKAYDTLKRLEGRHWAALNNLVYYSCLFGKGDLRRDFFLTQARALKQIGQEFNLPDYLLTYCRVILQYGTDDEETSDAYSIAMSLASAPLSDIQKKEATFYVTSLSAKLATESKTTKA